MAVAISPGARDFLRRFVAEARRMFPSYRFGPAENLHLTLQFLGEVERSRIPELCGTLSSAARSLPQFSASLGEAGSFPARGVPRILHVAVDQGKEQLTGLARRVAASLSPLGFRPDKPFAAHITLGRSRDRDQRATPAGDVSVTWQIAFAEFQRKAEAPVTWDITEVVLMESILGPGGPTYLPRGTAPLSR